MSENKGRWAEVKTTYYKNATDFLQSAGKYLASNEARYALIIGIAKAVEINPHHYSPDGPWFCSVATGKEANAAAIRTPPYMVLMAYFSGNIEAIAVKLVQAVAKDFKAIPGVVADKELGDLFASRWCKKFGARITHTQAQRIYRLVKVNNVPLSPGRMRVATMADKELVIKWAHAFHIDVGGEVRHAAEGDPTPGLEHGWVFFWEDGGRQVSMAVKTRPTEKGITVGGVYTPPELRGKGYATSCVAELSRQILQSGLEFCTLYTDLANPTSNSIYMKIGYEPVCDSVEYTFEMPPEQPGISHTI
jgi:predicted GNAT family acetyltransferase